MNGKPVFQFPPELPVSPKGWTRNLLMHINYGGKGKSAGYEIVDDTGALTPIGYFVDTRAGGGSGFTLPGIDVPMNWNDLRKAWPAWRKKHLFLAEERAAIQEEGRGT